VNASWTTKGAGVSIDVTVSDAVIGGHDGHRRDVPGDVPGAASTFPVPGPRDATVDARGPDVALAPPPAAGALPPAVP